MQVIHPPWLPRPSNFLGRKLKMMPVVLTTYYGDMYTQISSHSWSSQELWLSSVFEGIFLSWGKKKRRGKLFKYIFVLECNMWLNTLFVHIRAALQSFSDSIFLTTSWCQYLYKHSSMPVPVSLLTQHWIMVLLLILFCVLNTYYDRSCVLT